MNNPKVSVVIPVYNVEKYLRQCLESVVNQTLREIEIICVNDGSPDNSRLILAEYAAKDDRIVIIDQENKGLSGARNSGMNAATGKYIYFLDSDDYIELNTLEVLFQVCEEKKLEVVSFDKTLIYEDGRPSKPERRNICPDIHTGIEYMSYDKEYSVYVWSFMYLRTFLSENNITFKEGIIHEDNLFTFYVMMHVQRLHHVPERFYYYRKAVSGSIMTSKKSRKINGYSIGSCEMLRFGLSNSIDRQKAKEIVHDLTRVLKYAKQDYKKCDSEEKATIVFDDPITEFLYQQFVVKEVEREQLSKQVKKLKKEVKDLKKKQQKIQNSLSFRIGRIITYVPRMVRTAMRKVKKLHKKSS